MEDRRAEFIHSDVVVIAKIIDFSTARPGLFSAQAIEVFKGDLKESQLFKGGFDWFCMPFIDTLGTWVIYGQLQDSLIYINSCGGSRDINYPETSHGYGISIPPPPLDSSMTEAQFSAYKDSMYAADLAFTRQALKDELTDLRERRNRELNETSEEPYSSTLIFIGLLLTVGLAIVIGTEVNDMF